MNTFVKRMKGKIVKTLRDNFGFFLPLGNNTVKAVIFSLDRKIQGHYYEFGLYQGYTFSQAVKYSPGIHHFGFDSFQGMPENNEGGGFFANRFKVDYKKVVNSLLKVDAFSHREHLIKGFFSESLTQELQNELKAYPAAVILIDSDLYESAVDVLNFIVPLLQNGTIVIFDDWYAFDSRGGEQRALQEFLSHENNYEFIELNEFKARKIFEVKIISDAK